MPLLATAILFGVAGIAKTGFILTLVLDAIVVAIFVGFALLWRFWVWRQYSMIYGNGWLAVLSPLHTKRCKVQDLKGLVGVTIAQSARLSRRRLLVVRADGTTLASVPFELWAPAELAHFASVLNLGVQSEAEPQTLQAAAREWPGAVSWGELHASAIGVTLALLIVPVVVVITAIKRGR